MGMFNPIRRSQRRRENEKLVAEAREAGVDERSLSAMKARLDKTLVFGNVGEYAGNREKYLAQKSGLEATIKTLPEREIIKAERDRRVQRQALLLKRPSGRRALLQSPTGGRGFFGGYFK